MNSAATARSSGVLFDMPDSQGEIYSNSRPRWIALIIGMLSVFLIVLFVADRLFNPNKFQIKEIVVNGNFAHVNSVQVRRIVEKALEGNYFSISLNRLEDEIKKVPWVFSASLRRQWPSTIAVEVVEVQPVAKWGQDKWLNFTGDLVGRQQGGGIDNDGLPLLYGPENQQQEIWKSFQKWSERFASYGLSLDELRLDPSGLWNLKLSLGALALNSDRSNQEIGKVLPNTHQVSMIVDKENAMARIQRFIGTLDQELLIKFPEMESVDLRYPNGFAISWYESKPGFHSDTESNPDLAKNTEPSID